MGGCHGNPPLFAFCPHLHFRILRKEKSIYYPASRGFSLVFLSVELPFSSRFWLLAVCFGCFCAEEKTSADSRMRFLLNMRCRYLQDLGGNHTKLSEKMQWNSCATKTKETCKRERLASSTSELVSLERQTKKNL